ncbi:MAG: hypothetical protein OXE78_00825 [Gammaproteobacteria bacterium]|nr:hypothetical protein [Gammaproteobacteria bacterium]MCY4357156.1 hypothetical protein [Gammaproteobacteria bacterium]
MAVTRQGQETSTLAATSLRKLSGKFSLAVCLLLLLAMCVFWLVSSYNTRNLLRQQADGLGQTLVEQTASQLTELVLANDLISMNVVLSSLVRDPSIQEITIRSVDNDILSNARSETAPLRPLIPLPLPMPGLKAVYKAQITLPDSVIGFVELSLNLDYIEVGTNNNLIMVIGATSLLLIVALVMTTTYCQYLVSFPANLLSFALSNIRKGEIDTCPEPETRDEMSQVIRQYNATAEFIAQNSFIGSLCKEESDNTPQGTADEHDHRNVSLLIISMANFHYLASTVSVDRFLGLLNRCYFFADKISQLYNGRVSYCSEGEVIINFSEALADEDQAFYAICAGQLFLQLVGEINNVGGIRLQSRYKLAMHGGQQFDLLYSPLTGTHNNLTGKVLDQLREICYECPNNSLLVSEVGYEQAGAYSRIDANEFAIVGNGESIQTYLVSDPMTDYRLLLERQAARLAELYAD